MSDIKGQLPAPANGRQRPIITIKKKIETADDDETLDLKQAAKFCKMNHECFRRKVKSGEIPAAKVGKAWVVYKPDLIRYIRSLYATSAKGAVEVTGKEVTPCRSTVEARSGGSVSRRQMDDACNKALEPNAK